MAGALLSTEAFAGDARKKMFVDWDYAVRVWTTLPTGEAFDREYDRVNPAYEAWKRENPGSNLAALASLKGKEGERVRQGHDLNMVYAMWKEVYGAWSDCRGITCDAEPWHQNTRCGLIEATNIFTGQCNDMPDWRTEEDVARDDRVLADYRAKQAKKAATN